MAGPVEAKNPHPVLLIDGNTLSLEDVEKIARRSATIELADHCIPRIERSREAVERIVEKGDPVYGVNTGFGALGNVAIPASSVETIQHNLLRSHAAGTGPHFDGETARAIMLARANSLARGYSGVSTGVIQQILDLLNAAIVPAIPEQGSLGASGDLAPLAHLALVLTGEGQVVEDGSIVPAEPALRVAGIEPLVLGPKEALAIINGTAVMAGIAILALLDAEMLVRTAIAVGALSCFALGARREPFDPRLDEARPQAGQRAVATAILDLLGPLDKKQRVSARVQDPYSVRAIPPVYGAVSSALRPLRDALEIELNSATDNPLVFPDTGEAISGANFHGHPLALPLEFAKVAIASLGTITERRVALMMDGVEYGIPPFLVANPGLNSGYMIAHYLTAGLVAENKILAHPAAVDSIPTSANVEDYNSMGTIGARHFRDITANVERIVAVEALCAAQACDLRSMAPAGKLGMVYETIRSCVPMLERDDRVVAIDIETVWQLVHSGSLADQIGEEWNN